jgi:iron complex outermembrane receptor protein
MQYKLITAIALFTIAPDVIAQRPHHHDLEELIVSGPLQKDKAGTSLPVNVIDGEDLLENVANTLGDTLNGQIGVNSSSFGPGVGLPVIRGQSGNRVRVLQDGLGTLDVSSISQDHNNSVEPILAERIEIIRGPATLLYGNGAIGGVVNVIDNRIPQQIPENTEGKLELRYNSAAKGKTGVFKLDSGVSDHFAWHIDGVFREQDNIEIPGMAIDETALEILHDDEEEEEEIDNTDGYIANSDGESTSFTAGASYIGERGFFGLSVNQLENEYGIPPGGHAHNEEDGEEEEEELIRLDMEQTRYDLKGALSMDGFIEQLRARISYNDYEHQELEVIGANRNSGTLFQSKGTEARLTLHQRAVGMFSGVFGLQVIDSKFGAEGEESYIPASDIGSVGVFVVESLDAEKWSYEYGLRIESQSVDPGTDCAKEENTWSASTAAIWRFRDDGNLMLALNRSERSASVEELFSNINRDTCAAPVDPDNLVRHNATARFEIGNPDLKMETASNIELALRKHTGDIQGEVNIFYNNISDYIYMQDTEDELDETIISRYRQQDALFTGIEFEVTFPFEPGTTAHLDLSLFGDYVRAKFDSGGYVPRIPARRYGAELAYIAGLWSLKLRATDVGNQTRVAENELPGNGYMLVDLYFDYHFVFSDKQLLFFMKGNNLLDEEIRNHTSLLKNFAPEAGRGYEAGLQFQF